MSDLERNKRNVIAFYEMMFNQNRPADAIEHFVGSRYIQHDPEVADGKQGFIAHFERMAAEHPGRKMHVVRTVAEGNYVVLHNRQEWPGFPDFAAIDIFRLSHDGKIVEHWDVLQPVPKKLAHKNGMF